MKTKQKEEIKEDKVDKLDQEVKYLRMLHDANMRSIDALQTCVISLQKDIAKLYGRLEKHEKIHKTWKDNRLKQDVQNPQPQKD